MRIKTPAVSRMWQKFCNGTQGAGKFPFTSMMDDIVRQGVMLAGYLDIDVSQLLVHRLRAEISISAGGAPQVYCDWRCMKL